MVTDWIDEIAKTFEVSDLKGGTVRSYRVYEKDEFPESLSEFPCALTYTLNVRSEYDAGGKHIDHWEGVTEFHLTPSVAKNQFPYIMRFFALVRNAAATHAKLNNTVSVFLLRRAGGATSIEGPVVLQYGSDEPHLGLRAFWTVKEEVSSEFTFSV